MNLYFIKKGAIFMKKKRFHLSMVFLLTLSMILAACGNKEDAGEKPKGGDVEEKPKFISILTGGTGGTYYPLGGSFAKIIKDETGIDTNAETSGASAENMTTLKNGDAEIAFSQT